MEITNKWIYVPKLNKFQAEQMGAVWNNSRNMYRLPNTIGALEDLKRSGYHTTPYIIKQLQARQKLLDLKRLDDVEGDPRLRPYQRVDVNYLKRINSAGIFNEQRTGERYD